MSDFFSSIGDIAQDAWASDFGIQTPYGNDVGITSSPIGSDSAMEFGREAARTIGPFVLGGMAGGLGAGGEMAGGAEAFGGADAISGANFAGGSGPLSLGGEAGFPGAWAGADTSLTPFADPAEEIANLSLDNPAIAKYGPVMGPFSAGSVIGGEVAGQMAGSGEGGAEGGNLPQGTTETGATGSGEVASRGLTPQQGIKAFQAAHNLKNDNPLGAAMNIAGLGGDMEGVSFISPDSVNPVGMSPETMSALGIGGDDSFMGATMMPLASTASGMGGPEAGGISTSSGDFNPGAPSPQVGDAYSSMAAPTDSGGMMDQASAMLKKLGLSPATAAMLGISGVQGLMKPKIPEAAQKLSDQAGPNAAAASAVIQSGGTSSPAWGTQKASIDATIDQQIQQQSQALLQQAQNSGQGADSQVTQQQINKLKNDLETKRQTLYAQAQAQNVQTAVQSLGISDQALAQVANAQFRGDEQAKASASATAQNALMLQALSKSRGGQPDAVPA